MSDEQVNINKTVPEIINDNITFRWFNRGREFGGMNEARLRILTGEIAVELGITAEQAQLTRIVFGDDLPIVLANNQIIRQTGITVTSYDESGQVLGSAIFINRSLDRAKNMQSLLEESQSQLPNREDFLCEFESPEEYLIWVICEELHHAKLRIQAGNLKKAEQYQSNWSEILRRKQVQVSTDYTHLLEEVAASRRCLRMLRKFIGRTNPERAIYFDKLYKESLKHGQNIYPNYKKIIDLTFIKCFSY